MGLGLGGGRRAGRVRDKIRENCIQFEDRWRGGKKLDEWFENWRGGGGEGGAQGVSELRKT